MSIHTLYRVINIVLKFSFHLLIVGEVTQQQARGVEDGGDGGVEGGEAGEGDGVSHDIIFYYTLNIIQYPLALSTVSPDWSCLSLYLAERG